MTKPPHESFAELDAVERAHRELDLSYREIARVIGADESSLHRWRRGESDPSLVFVRQLRQLGRCLDQLASVFSSWERARAWMTSQPELLSGERPIDVLQDGETDRVIGALYVLEETSAT